jgi:hypothetical protein
MPLLVSAGSFAWGGITGAGIAGGSALAGVVFACGGRLASLPPVAGFATVAGFDEDGAAVLEFAIAGDCCTFFGCAAGTAFAAAAGAAGGRALFALPVALRRDRALRHRTLAAGSDDCPRGRRLHYRAFRVGFRGGLSRVGPFTIGALAAGTAATSAFATAFAAGRFASGTFAAMDFVADVAAAAGRAFAPDVFATDLAAGGFAATGFSTFWADFFILPSDLTKIRRPSRWVRPGVAGHATGRPGTRTGPCGRPVRTPQNPLHPPVVRSPVLRRRSGTAQ